MACALPFKYPAVLPEITVRYGIKSTGNKNFRSYGVLHRCSYRRKRQSLFDSFLSN